MSDSKIIVALDYDDLNLALAFVDRVDPALCRLKVGKEMFTLFGPQFVTSLQQKGFDVFLDLKFHDIPTTCAKAIRAAADLGVWMVNLHTSGGEKMMAMSKEILEPYGADRPLLIGVTVLTSMEQVDLAGIGIERSPFEQALHLAHLASRVGLDGVVCSAQEAGEIKLGCGHGFLTVTPGIRPVGAELSDQKRVLTPQQAISSGSDFLVIGRPITQAREPLFTLQEIQRSLSL